MRHHVPHATETYSLVLLARGAACWQLAGLGKGGHRTAVVGVQEGPEVSIVGRKSDFALARAAYAPPGIATCHIVNHRHGAVRPRRRRHRDGGCSSCTLAVRPRSSGGSWCPPIRPRDGQRTTMTSPPTAAAAAAAAVAAAARSRPAAHISSFVSDTWMPRGWDGAGADPPGLHTDHPSL